MKKINLATVLILALGLTTLPACGVGGINGTSPPTQPTTGVLTLSTAVTGTIPTGTTINSYNVTITLPAGVTVKTMLNSSATGTGVVTASGMASGAAVEGVYTAATGTFPGMVKIYVASATGFAAGEFCKVNCNIAAGHYPTASDFQLPTLDDVTGFDTVSQSTVTGLTGELSLTETAAIH
jgi:hypothetical protein